MTLFIEEVYHPGMKMTRKEFLQAGLALAGAMVLPACGGAAVTDDMGSGNCLANGTRIVIGANHGHVLVVPKEDVAAGVQKSYDFTGSDHVHSVALSANHFATLKVNGMISVVSSTTLGHEHTVAVSCA
jgi:hypothetical protein